MTTGTELVPEKIRARIAQTGLLVPDETVIAYVNGRGRSGLERGLRVLLGPLLSVPLILRGYRAAVLTDRQLYVCTMKFGPAGALKSVIATYPRGSYTASLTDGRGATLWLQIEGEAVRVPSRGGMRGCADAIVAAAGH